MLLFLVPHRLRRRLAENETLAKLLNLGLLFALSCLLFATGLRLSEDKMGWGEAWWQVWQTVTTVGYGNQPAQTPLGRAATMLFGLGGIALLGALISTWFDWRADKRERRRYGQMENTARNGYVVINFPGVSRFTALVTEIAALEEAVHVCVVCSRIDELPVSVQHFPRARIHFVKGNLLAEDTYERAGVADARTVIVFPQETGVPESDATTKIVVDLVSRFARPDARLLHVLVEPANEWLFEGSRSAAIYETDEILLLVQECHDARSAEMVQNLLLNSRGANPRTVTPRHTHGWTWAQFQRACVDAAERDRLSINPLAILRANGPPEPCPPPDARIEPGDRLSVIVPNGFDWDGFEARLSRPA